MPPSSLDTQAAHDASLHKIAYGRTDVLSEEKVAYTRRCDYENAQPVQRWV